MNAQRRTAALTFLAIVFLATVSAVAWTINTYDWGIALMLLVPLLVYGLIRLARRLEEWVDPP